MLWESLTPASRTTTSSWFETLTTSSSSSSCQSRTERTSHKSSTAAVPQRPASTLLRGTPDLPAEDFEVDPGKVRRVAVTERRGRPVVAQRLLQIVQGGSKKSQKTSLQLSVHARPHPAH